MEYKDLVKSDVLSQPVYQPGKPIEYVAKEFGLNKEEILKLASNENPLGPSPKAVDAAKLSLNELNLYPDGGCTLLRDKIAGVRGIRADQIVVGNGSNEIMELLAHGFIGAGDEVVMGEYAFIVYKLVTLLFGAKPIEVKMPNYRHDLDLMREAVTDKTKVVFLPSPNNPTGTANSQSEIVEFVESLPEHVIFCLDEAYAEYIDDAPDLRPLIDAGRKVFCTRTFSKIYGLAGCRVGYGYGHSDLIELLHRVREPFNVNSVAQAAALAALSDIEFVSRSKEVNERGLKQLGEGLKSLEIPVVPSVANFVLVEWDEPLKLYLDLQKQGIIVRPVLPYGLERHVRISVGSEEQNEAVLRTMEAMVYQKGRF